MQFARKGLCLGKYTLSLKDLERQNKKDRREEACVEVRLLQGLQRAEENRKKKHRKRWVLPKW